MGILCTTLRLESTFSEKNQANIIKLDLFYIVRGYILLTSLSNNNSNQISYLFADLLILLLLVGGLQSLPWQVATVEVHEYVAKRFHVIATTLLNT